MISAKEVEDRIEELTGERPTGSGHQASGPENVISLGIGYDASRGGWSRDLGSNDQSVSSAQIKSESKSNQNQIISGFFQENPDRPEAHSYGDESNQEISDQSNGQGLLRKPAESGEAVVDEAKATNTSAWGELPLYETDLPFAVRNMCVQVFFQPKDKATGKPLWGAKVEINNADQECRSQTWETIWSGTLLPEKGGVDLFQNIAAAAYDLADPQQDAYVDKCIDLFHAQRGTRKMVCFLAKHSKKGGRTSNLRPLHMLMFVDMGKYDCSRADVVQRRIWEGKAIVILGDQSFQIDLKWKPGKRNIKTGKESSRYIAGRIIYQGYWFANGDSFTMDMGDQEFIKDGDYDFS